MCSLGYLCDRGWGVPQDDVQALRLYSEAANLGVAQCQFNLGVFYRDGRGGPRDLVASYVWFSLAARTRFPQASAKAATMKARLTPDEVAKAERQLGGWKLQPKGP